MRIAYLLPAREAPSTTDDDRLRLARTFTSLGHEVAIVAVGEAPSSAAGDLDVRLISLDPFDDRALELLGAEASEQPELRHAVRALLEGAALRERAAAALGGFRPDLVYERWAPFTAAGARLARELGSPSLVEVTDSDGSRDTLSATVEGLERAALESADHVVAASEAQRARLVATGLDGAKIVAVPPAVEADGYDMTPPVRDAQLPRMGLLAGRTQSVRR